MTSYCFEKKAGHRSCNRIIVSLNAEIILDDESIAGRIENLSEDGLYMIATPSKTSINFSPESKFTIKIHLASKETRTFLCKVKWSYKTPPHELTNSLGMEIIAPYAKYKDLLKALVW